MKIFREEIRSRSSKYKRFYVGMCIEFRKKVSVIGVELVGEKVGENEVRSGVKRKFMVLQIIKRNVNYRKYEKIEKRMSNY